MSQRLQSRSDLVTVQTLKLVYTNRKIGDNLQSFFGRDEEFTHNQACLEPVSGRMNDF